MSMSGSFHDPGPATSVKPLDLCEASAQNSTIVLRLCQVDWMSSQLRHRLQFSCSSAYGVYRMHKHILCCIEMLQQTVCSLPM